MIEQYLVSSKVSQFQVEITVQDAILGLDVTVTNKRSPIIIKKEPPTFQTHTHIFQSKVVRDTNRHESHKLRDLAPIDQLTRM